MSIDPLTATKTIKNNYVSYLTTTFRFQSPELQDQFKNMLLEPESFVKGPILEATPSYQKGASIAQLVEEGVLAQNFYQLGPQAWPLERPLYLHQETAIRKLVKEKRNIVVATGTGSGKTEAFLIPIINHLFREEEAGICPGVRALLLYPMNALANDQLQRMRVLLANYPQITFGRYTGETPEREREAIEYYKKMYDGDLPLPNELISREKMRRTPPHILLTNYAMLEYLLLRPADSIFFDGPQASYWRFLVLDEAHTYTGAKGIETAMLLRRLKERICKSEHGKLQCIATSATLGRGRQDFGKIADFASQLFSEKFIWNEENNAEQDIIEAEKIPLVQQEKGWGKPEAQVYTSWLEIIRKGNLKGVIEKLAETGVKFSIPEQVLEKSILESSGNLGAFLYRVLCGDHNLITTQKYLQEGPQLPPELAHKVFPDGENLEHFIALVELANMAQQDVDSTSLLPARYHLFVRAPEGAYLSLLPKIKLFIKRQKQYQEGEHHYPVFETATCRQCGALYLLGQINGHGSRPNLCQPDKTYEKVSYFLVCSPDTTITPVDEDDQVVFKETEPTPDHLDDKYRYLLCGKCGAIDRATLLAPLCSCKDSEKFELLYVEANEDSAVTTCPACGRSNPIGIVTRFLAGSDALASVLATALYQEIHPEADDNGYVSNKANKQKADTAISEWSSTEQYAPEDEWGTTSDEKNEKPPKLLVFSDSRQDAAFFAPYLNRTYSQILHRHLILDVLQENGEQALKRRWRVQDLIEPIFSLAEKKRAFPAGLGLQEKENMVWKWVFYEFLGFNRRVGLEGQGILGYSLVKPEHWSPPPALMRSPWFLTSDEVWTLFEVLLDTLRSCGAVTFPEMVYPRDPFFAPRNREISIRGNVPNRARGIVSWNSQRINKRLDYLLRLGKKIAITAPDKFYREVLHNLWAFSLKLSDPTSCWKDYFQKENIPGEGVVFKLRYNFWELSSPLINQQLQWYICDKCSNLTLFNITGTCPTFRCQGELHPCDPDIIFKDNHYRQLYWNISPVPLKSEEHTAQLKSDVATELQTLFVKGAVNVLSCSTTFELGVDVGELEAVFLRNVPPSTANYIQRAGRAGRRLRSSAFVLTLAQLRSHDLDHYHDPRRMVSGKIAAPYFKLENEKIIRRHIFASAISAFWKEYPGYFGKVHAFFFQNITGPEQLNEFLNSKPQHLQEALTRIVPEQLQEKMDIPNWGWVELLLNNGSQEENGTEQQPVLTRACEEVVSDIRQLEEIRDDLVKENKRVDHITRLITTIKQKYIIDFLASRNVLPKYGFPVDVVELFLSHHGEEAKRLQLERDLRIAIAEYAPSCQVVAGGKLWTSTHIKRLPRREWESFSYVVCDNCQSYSRIRALHKEQLKECEACKQPLRVGKRTFLIPAFGFISYMDKPRNPGEKKPERTYASRIYFSGKSNDYCSTELPLNICNIKATAATWGKLAVVNNAGGYGFKICPSCGFAVVNDQKVGSEHRTAYGKKCRGKLIFSDLGHEFETDIIKLSFDGYQDTRPGFWFSLLYGLLEGASVALQIERLDIDGCLYASTGDPYSPSLVLFDDVPGGAGHVARLADPKALNGVLKATLERLQRCDCGGPQGDTSCYSCLRHYRNQFCHELLNRGMVIGFLNQLFDK